MGLRNRTQQPFWRTTPTKTSNPDALYQYGIEAVGKRDGKAMIATGWALCQVASLHEHQASDFLTDGYRIWRESPNFDRSQAAGFLTDLFGALSSLTPPEVPSDIWSAAPESVMPASIYYGLRCWAGNELLEVTTDPATRAQYEPLVFRSAADAPHDFVPTRSIEFAKSYAAANGLPEPWVIVLPSPRDHVLAGAGATGAGATGAGATGAGTSVNGATANGASGTSGGSGPSAYPEEPQLTKDADESSDTAAQSAQSAQVAETPQVSEAPQAQETPQTSETAQTSEAPQPPAEQNVEVTRIQERPAPAEASNEPDQNWHPDAPAHVEESVRLVPAAASASTAEYTRPAPQPTSEHAAPASPPASPPQSGPSQSGPSAAQQTGQPVEPRSAEQPVRPRPRPTPTGSSPRPQPTPSADARPRPNPAPAAPPSAPTSAPTDSESTTVLSPVMGPPAGAPVSAPPPPVATGPAPTGPAPSSNAPASDVPPRLADLRRRLREWLESSYHGVEVEDNSWITVPDIGPSTVQVEASLVQGGHLKVEVFTPVLIDAPLTPDLLRYVAVEGGRFHFGSMSLDVDEDEHALLQFSHSLIADNLDRDAFLAVVWLVASTVVERSPDLQQRFGGALFRELTSA